MTIGRANHKDINLGGGARGSDYKKLAKATITLAAVPATFNGEQVKGLRILQIVHLCLRLQKKKSIEPVAPAITTTAAIVST